VLDLLDKHGVSRIVIVEDDQAQTAVGVLTKADLAHAYAKALRRVLGGLTSL